MPKSLQLRQLLRVDFAIKIRLNYDESYSFAPNYCFQDMFIRLYTGIALSLALSAIFVYTTYHIHYKHQLTEYSDAMLSGTLHLLLQGYDRQTSENKAEWQQLISRMTGIDTVFSTPDSTSNNRITKKIDIDLKQNITASLQNQQNKLTVKLKTFGEQQYRGIALLMVNELARVSRSDVAKKLTQLKSLYPFPIRIIDKDASELDEQQLARLNLGYVVVDQHLNSDAKVIHTRLNNKQILMVGPIAPFNPITIELIGVVTGGSIIITMLFTYIFIYRLESRLNLINRFINSFRAGNTDLRIPVRGNDIVASLGKRFNEMANRIEDLLAHHNEISRAVSHELRTPLARIKFRLELVKQLSQSGEDPKSIDDKLSGIYRDIKELESLIDETLLFYQYDNYDGHYEIKSLSVSHVVMESINAIQEQFPRIQIQSSIPKKMFIFGNSTDIPRMLQNLISNACKHANKRVEVLCFKSSESELIIAVGDDGPGISNIEKEKIFQPFTRLEHSRNKKVSGYGLGLAIVERIVKNNHARIRVTDSHMGGAVFEVTLPLAFETDVES